MERKGLLIREMSFFRDVYNKFHCTLVLSIIQAIFEIITSEASYHLNLTTLIERFMDDPKLDPNTSDSALDRTQHSMIFSNVREIRSVSAR